MSPPLQVMDVDTACMRESNDVSNKHVFIHLYVHSGCKNDNSTKSEYITTHRIVL